MKDTTTQTSSASSLTSLSANPRRRLAVRTANGVARRPLEPVNGAPKKNEFRLEEKLAEAFSEETPPVNILKEPVALATFRTLNTNSPDFIDKVLLCIETDFHLALQCIVEANSGEYRARARTENLKQAFVRLGFTVVQNFALNYDLSLHTTKENGCGRLWFKSLRRQCSLIAMASYCHATVFRGENPENCYLVGLFHDIGAVYLSKLIMTEMSDTPNISNFYGATGPSADTQNIEEAGKKYNPMILKNMRFPTFVIEALNFKESDGPEENYFRNALKTSHIIEACYGDLLLPGKPVEYLSDGKKVEEDSSGEWSRATKTATAKIQEGMPEITVKPEQVEEIATLVKSKMEKTASFIEFD